MSIALSDIEQLSVKERIELIGKIWDSIEASSKKTELTQAQKDELDRRLEKHKANPDQVVSWEEVQAKMKRSRG